MPRPLAARVLAVLAVVVLAAAVVAGYVSRAVFDSRQFANRATATLEDDRVRTVVARRITDDVVLRRRADLLAARPLLESVVSGVVGSRAFTSVFRDAVRDVHRAVIDGDRDTVTLTLADVGTLVEGALREVAPEVAAHVEAVDEITVLRRDVGAVAARAAHTARSVRHLALGLGLLALVLAAAAVAVAPDRRAQVFRLGVGAGVAGGAIVVLALLGRAVLLAGRPADERAVGGAIWDTFGAGLVTAAWVTALCGAIVAAAAGSVLRPLATLDDLRDVAERLLAEPRRPVLRVVRALALLAVGIGALAAPMTAARIAALAAGVLLTYAGVDALLRVVYRPATARTPRLQIPVLRLAGFAVVGVFAAAIVAGFLRSDDVTASAPRIGACNGSAELCDRPLTEVALVATHNAMSVPSAGWFAAEQDGPIGQQLRDGVRGLLLDTHYADKLPNGRIRTVITEGSKGRDALGPRGTAAAERLRDRAGFRGRGQRGMYLCHTFCELGATRLSSALDVVHDFLVTHPEEVVVVINQDDVAPESMVRAVREAGLDRLAFTPPAPGEAWPTLREMIDRDERFVLLAEERAGGAPWNQLAYERHVQETPYTFPSAARLTDPARRAATCAPNRGRDDAPLFLLNHWVSTDPVPRPSDAERVNARGPLLARARECERLRGRLPNLIAVNFARRGDVRAVVRALNRQQAGE